MCELQTRDRVYKRVKMDIRPKREGALMPLEVENISFHYSGQPQLYKDLSFRINGKERFLVVGENGVGKSTLLKLIMGILIPEQGRVHYIPKRMWLTTHRNWSSLIWIELFYKMLKSMNILNVVFVILL